MRSVFADTFYRAALTSTQDAAHESAISLSRSIEPEMIVTTDEVLAEYLAFFAGARPSVRAQAGSNVAALIKSPMVSVVPKAGNPSLQAWSSIGHAPTRATAW
jgi:uncharacterized protein